MKTRLFAGIVAVAAVTAALELSVAPTASAQPPSRGQDGSGRGTGGGARGFGGGMMRGGDPVMGLLRSDEVRKELKVDAEQEAGITKIEQQVRDQPRGDADARIDFRNASEEERQKFFAKMKEAQKEQAAKSHDLLQEVLLPAQLQRLDELAMQRRGVMALNDPEVQKSLGMTAQQVEKLDEVRSEQETAMRDKMREARQSGDRSSMREKMGEYREQLEQSVLSVLSTDQKAKFEKMKGAEFDFGDRGGFGARRGGDRAGRGGGRGGDRAGRGGRGGGRGGDRN